MQDLSWWGRITEKGRVLEDTYKKPGFSKWVKENADSDRVRLVALEELYD